MEVRWAIVAYRAALSAAGAVGSTGFSKGLMIGAAVAEDSPDAPHIDRTFAGRSHGGWDATLQDLLVATAFRPAESHSECAAGGR